MVDIAPELYKEIQRRFQEKYDKAQLFGNPISDMRKKLDAGTATFQDADLFAVEIGNMLSESMIEVLQLDQLPNKQLYYNIAQRTIGNSLQETYGLVSSVAAEVQEELNAAAGIGIRAMTPKVNEDRIHGLVDKAVEAPDQAVLNKILQSPVENLMMSAVDDTVKANAELQSKAGLQPIIRRTTVGKCCDWCSALADTYRYPDDVPKDVYRRHQNCRCTVEYIGAGKRKDVWSKREDVLTQEEAKRLNDEIESKQVMSPVERLQMINAAAHPLKSEYLQYNPDAVFNIHIDSWNNSVNESVNRACKEVIDLAQDGKEHLILVDTVNGKWVYSEAGDEISCGGPDFWSFIKREENKNKSICFVHSHSVSGGFSEIDMVTLLGDNPVNSFVASQIDGKAYVVIKKSSPETMDFDKLYENKLLKLNVDARNGKISSAQRSLQREHIIVDNLIKDYTKGVEIFE